MNAVSHYLKKQLSWIQVGYESWWVLGKLVLACSQRPSVHPCVKGRQSMARMPEGGTE
jgi:hypothetical protein